MKDFEVHTAAMLELLKGYAQGHCIMSEMSALLIVREVSKEKLPAGTALRMAIQGEDAPTAIQTIHHAAQILAQEVTNKLNETKVPRSLKTESDVVRSTRDRGTVPTPRRRRRFFVPLAIKQRGHFA